MDSTIFLSILTNTQAILVVCLALFLEKCFPIASRVNPLSFFYFVCQRMANKVLRQPSDVTQSVIAGALALLVLTVPILLIIALIHAFADYKWLTEALLLWVLLQYRQDLAVLQNGVKALRAHKNLLAKNLCQQKLLRDTQALTSLGLSKASLESAFLRYHHQQFVTVVCFLVLGPIPALGYRLVYISQQAWNIKRENFRAFGLCSNVINLVFQSIPSVIFSFTFLLLCKPIVAIKHLLIKQYWQTIFSTLLLKKPQTLMLSTLSTSLNVNTGGPVMYDKIKYPRERHYPLYSRNRSKEPEASDLPRLVNKINQHLLLCILALFLIIGI